MIIYLVTNTTNGKKYVGQTTGTVEARWKRHVYDASRGTFNMALHKAIRKYGADAFTVQVLFTCQNKKTLDLYERGHIKFFKCRTHGYNLTDGGEGVVGYVPSDETRAKLRAARLGKTASEESKRKASKALKGIVRSEETRQKMSVGKEYPTHCRNGHLRTSDNTTVVRGNRLCRLCARQRSRKYDHKRRG